VPISMGQLANVSDVRYNAAINYTPPLGWYIYSWNTAFQLLNLSRWEMIAERGALALEPPTPENRYGGVFTTGLSRDMFGDNLDDYQWLTEPTFQFRIRPIPPTIEKASAVFSGTAPVHNGDIIEYTITVRNPATGWGAFNNFFIEDSIPAGLEPIAGSLTVSPAVADAGVNISGNTLSGALNIPPANDPESGGVLTITFLARVTDRDLAVGGEFLNTVHLYNPERERISSGTDEGIPVADPAITIEKSVSDDQVYAGDDLAYTLVVTNTGNVPLYDVTVTDAFEDMLEYLDSDQTEPVTIVFSGGRAPMTVTLAQLIAGQNIGRLEVGETATLTFTVTVAEDVYGGTVLNNTATTSGTTRDNEEVTASDSAATTVVSEPSIEIIKSVNADEVFAGDDLTYTLIMTNRGNVTLHDVTVTDPLTYVLPHLSSNQTVPVTITFSGDRAPMTTTLAELMAGYNIGTLAVGEIATLTFTVTVADDVYGGTVLDNTATVSGIYAGETVEDDSDATTIVISEPEIEIIKSVNEDEVRAGDDLVYTLVVINTGNVTLHDVIVTDALTEMLPYLDLNGNEEVEITFSDGRDSISVALTELMSGYNIGILGVDEYVTLTFIVRVAEDAYACTILTNTALVSSTYDSEPVEDDASATTRVISRPGIAITKAVDQAEVYAGDLLTYTLIVTNTGNITLNNVTVRDSLNEMIAHLALDGTEEVTVVFSDGRDPLTFHLTQLMLGLGRDMGTLDVDETATLTFTVTVADDVYGGTVLNNTAIVTGTPASIASCDVGSPVSDSDSATTSVRSEPAIFIEKEVSDEEVYAGEDLTYTLIVTNIGNVTLHDVVVTDPLTAVLPHLSSNQTEPVTIVFSGGRAPIEITLAHLMSGYNIGTLSIYEYATLTFSVTVDANVYGGTVLNNTATARGIYNDETIEDDAFATTTVVRREPIPRYILRELIAEAEARIQANYTPRSWGDMQSMLTFARSVYNNPNLQDVQYDEAVVLLRARLDALVLR